MPAICTLASRRSPRLSIQDLQEDEGWENSAELLYPDFDPTTVALPLLPSTQSPSASPIVLPTLPAPSRTSHARQRPEHHIPRPPNAFILYRTDYCIWNKQLASGERDHRVVSKLAGEAWRHLHPESRAKYEEMAQERKRLHAIKYPHYRRTSTARSRGIGRKRKAEDDCDYQGHASHWCRRGSRDHTKPSPVTVDLESEDIADFSSPPSNSYKRARITLTTRSSAPSPEVDHSRTPELSPNSSSESPASDLSLRTPAVPQPGLTCEEGFIATADIPPLDLSASAPQEKKDIKLDRYLRPSSSYDVGSQFFKAEIPKHARDLCMWYNTDGTFVYHKASPASSLSSDAVDGCPAIDHSAVQFTNPFALAGLGVANELTYLPPYQMEDFIHMDRFD